MYTIPSGAVGTPYEGAIETVDTLKTKHNAQFTILSARWWLARWHTEKWLKRYGLGTAKLILADQIHPRDETRARFKYAVLRHLQRRKSSASILAIGDRPSDLIAYTAAGIPTLMLSHTLGVPLSHGTATDRAIKLESVARNLPKLVAPLVEWDTDCTAGVNRTQGIVIPPLQILTAGVCSETPSSIGLVDHMSSSLVHSVESETIWPHIEQNLHNYLNDAHAWCSGTFRA